MDYAVQVDLHNVMPAADAPASGKSPDSFLPRCWLEGGAAILDGSGRMLSVNEPLCIWLEKPAEALVGSSFWETLGGLSADWKVLLARIRESSAPFERLDLKLAADAAHPPHWFALEIGRGPQNGF